MGWLQQRQSAPALQEQHQSLRSELRTETLQQQLR